MNAGRIARTIPFNLRGTREARESGSGEFIQSKAGFFILTKHGKRIKTKQS